MNTELNQSHSPVLDAAMAFLAAGCSVVPAAMNGTKSPLGSWKQFQSERATAAQISQWFSNRETGIGIVTGAVSGNLEMLELEGRAVASGLLAEVREIAVNSGLAHIWDVIANGYVEQTPSGGIHFLYRIADESVPGNTKLARRPGENGAVDVLAETRGEGGFVVVAPSHGSVHPSGAPWVMLRGTAATIPTLSWEEREALHACFKALDAMPTAETVIEAISPKSEHQGLTPGDDYNARASWDEILLPLGWRKVFSSGGVIYWRRPGKNEGISATTGRNDGDNLYVFTTSTVFDAEKPYSKWAALTHLEFGGDFKASARHLRTMGYGAISAVPDITPAPLGLKGERFEDWQNSTNANNSSDEATIVPSQDSSPKSREEVEFEYQLQQARIRARVKQALEEEESAPEIDESVYEDSSWKPVDFTPFLDGTHQEVKPELMARSDGQFLLYAGKVHSFYGESESGKSWVAQYAAAEQLKLDKKVIYIDFESDPADLHKRLTLLGVERYQISKNWVYLKPESARDIYDPYWKALLEPGASLVVIDGVTEALTMWGGETKDNDSITKWMREFPRKIASESGAAVVQIDHVTKNSETRGRFAIGGQAKLATVDGAAYLIEPIEVLAPGKVGSLTMRVTKDRPGQVRSISGFYRKSDRTQEASLITVDSSGSSVKFKVERPLQEDELTKHRDDSLAKAIMEFVAKNPGTSKSAITGGVTGNNGAIAERIWRLEQEGHLANSGSQTRPKIEITSVGADEFGLVFQPSMGQAVGE